MRSNTAIPRFWAVFLVAAACAAAGGPLFAAPGTSVPACDKPVYDFGKRDNEETVAHTFELRNDGDAPLELAAMNPCCGATMELSAAVVPPGGRCEVRVALLLRGRYGEQRKSFFIRTNDPRRKVFELRMEGTATARVAAIPPAVLFGRVNADARETREVLVECDSNTTFLVTNTWCSNPCFEFRPAGGEGNTRRFIASTVPPLGNGVTRGFARIFTDHPKCAQIDIPLIARVSGDLVLVPDRLVLAVGKKVVEAADRYALLKSVSGRPFRILEADAGDTGIEVSWSPASGGGYRITMRGAQPTLDLDGKRISFRTDHREMKEVELPIQAIVPPGSAR